MSKIVFLDVDGTLIDYEAKLPASAAKAVDQARANGHKVYICTGCSKAEILQRNLCDLDGMIGEMVLMLKITDMLSCIKDYLKKM